jgi:hypothetical protein
MNELIQKYMIMDISVPERFMKTPVLKSPTDKIMEKPRTIMRIYIIQSGKIENGLKRKESCPKRKGIAKMKLHITNLNFEFTFINPPALFLL